MRTTLWLFIALLISNIVFAQGSKQITMEDLWKNNTFKVKDVPGFNAMKDGTHYTEIDHDGKHIYIRIYNLETGKQERTLFDNEAQKFGGSELNMMVTNLARMSKKCYCLPKAKIFTAALYCKGVYVYDIASGSIKLLDYDKVLHAAFSPDGQKVAFVKNNNLYYKDLQKDVVVPVTMDGEKNRIINGNCDWVYEEEFAFTRAFEWSADGSYLAYYRFDESLVPEYTIAKYTGLYPEQYTYKYPKAGERNSIIQVKIYDVQKKQTINANIGKKQTSTFHASNGQKIIQSCAYTV